MTKIESSIRNPKSAIIWTILGLLTVSVYFYGLTLPFLGPDEARYAQVAREMLDRGDWVTPTLGGFTWFEKPALLYWLEIFFFKLFGVNEFAARLGPALFGLGTVTSLWMLGRNLAAEHTEDDGKSKASEQLETKKKISVTSVANFANWLALLAASTLGIFVFSRGASFDIIITFPITAALVCFFRWHLRYEIYPASLRPRVSASLFFFYVFIGVALLAKGLIGIVFPFTIVGFYYVLSRRLPNRTFLLSVVWGTSIAIIIALIWYWPVYQQNGYAFIDEFFIQHHFHRFTSNKYQHPQPFYFFLWVLPLMTLPWLPFFVAGIWKFVRAVVQRKNAKTQGETSALHFSSTPILLFGVSWIAVPLVFFSFSGSKLPGYILPAIPGAVILTSVFIFGLVSKSERWRNAILAIAASMLFAMASLLTFAVPRFAESDSVRSLIAAANTGGYASNRVLSLHTISYNAEFYAAGRLLRDETGKQRRLSGVGEVISEINAENESPVLVLVPLEYVSQLTKDERIKTRILKDNGELAIALVSLK